MTAERELLCCRFPSRVPRVRSWARERSHDPVFWTDVIQVVQTVAAAVVAWILAADVFGLPQPFLAPWAALLVVHATVYRTFSRGAQQVAATVVGVVFAWGTGNLLGLDPIALTIMLLAASTIGHIAFLPEEATTIAATALIVLTTGYSEQNTLLIMRLLDTAIGVAVGLAVNVVVWPPLRDRAAARAIDAIDDKIGVLLCDMATALRNDPGDEELHSWVARTEDADIRSMVRTIEHSVTNVLEWDPRFRQSWVDLVEETGLAIGDADSARLSEVRRRLRRLADDLSTEDSLACTGRSTAVSSRICATSSTRWMSWQTKTRSPRRVHNRAPRPEFEGPPAAYLRDGGAGPAGNRLNRCRPHGRNR